MPPKFSSTIASQIKHAEKLFQSGKFEECVQFCSPTLKQKLPNLALLDLCAVANLQLGTKEQAILCYEKAVQTYPDQLTASLNLAKLLMDDRCYALALPHLHRSQMLDPNNEEVNFLLGTYFETTENHPSAIDSYSKVIAKNPLNVLCYIRISLILNQLKHTEAALEVLDTGLKINKDNADILYCKALVLDKNGMYLASLKSFEKLAKAHPQRIEYIFGYAEILKKTNRTDESEKQFQAALALDPNHVPSKINYGNLLCQLKRLNEGQKLFEEAFSIEPKNYQVLGNLASLMVIRRDLVQAWKYFELAYAQSTALAGSYLYSMAFQCEWDRYEEVLNVLKMDDKREMSTPFPAVIFATSAETHLAYAQRFAKNIITTGILGPISKYSGHQKIRVGYYSSDFYNHATMMLMEGMFKEHDRNRFEIHAFSLDHTRSDEHNIRARQLFDCYHDVHHLSDRAVALLSRNLEIDIAIDLKGYTEGSRTGIFAERAAPVQINFLGYPGSMGAPYMDYIIADSYIIPEKYQGYYSEKVLNMPHCYQPNNPARPRPDRSLSRPSELPTNTFVFCSFNSTYKITPEIFNLWMDLLNQAPQSVLWLLKSTEQAESNLKKYAQHHGVDPSRILFADIIPEAENLQRLSHADLFLDTFPCNAHTTASDSLWAGVPLLTISGETFPSRVAGSILQTSGLSELITTNKEDYFKSALKIYNDKVYLQKLKELTQQGIKNSPLYDVKKFTKSFENLIFNL
jgi:predicted O-linked N-acetylglucosamine transferase (SPINDLY family)